MRSKKEIKKMMEKNNFLCAVGDERDIFHEAVFFTLKWVLNEKENKPLKVVKWGLVNNIKNVVNGVSGERGIKKISTSVKKWKCNECNFKHKDPQIVFQHYMLKH